MEREGRVLYDGGHLGHGVPGWKSLRSLGRVAESLGVVMKIPLQG